MRLKFIDCTLRDGGYYNNWDFSPQLVDDYLKSVAAAGVTYAELGFRTFDKEGFKGPFAYTTDGFLSQLSVPDDLQVGVMVNASELLKYPDGPIAGVRALFKDASESPVDLVRLACHIHEFESTLPAATLLKDMGYVVGVNLMQIADRSLDEIESLANTASKYQLDALYFADSLGSLDPEKTADIVNALKRKWFGDLGIHTHDNMGQAMANTLRAIAEGVTWVDSTVTGMGRGPGNAQTEYLAIEVAKIESRSVNLSPLLMLIKDQFGPMQVRCGWGKNPYYYFAGQYGIHPTFIQEMLADSRYTETDILAVIEHLKLVGGKKFSLQTLDAGRQMYGGQTTGSWSPHSVIGGREVLIIGPGPSVDDHKPAIERFIEEKSPFVMALNTHSAISEKLIDVRVACHPFRLLADCRAYRDLSQPLVAPHSRLPEEVRRAIEGIESYDFGLVVEPGKFEFNENYAITPSLLVVAYALAIATSGRASRILIVGFDGFPSDDPRMKEMDQLLAAYKAAVGSLKIVSLTPTRYDVDKTSIYSF